MKKVAFKEVPVGGEFTHANTVWVKVEERRITCCKFTNAKAKDDNNRKIGFKAGDLVEVAE